MTTLADPSSTPRITLLNIGDSKSGKTGALASLAIAGYTLHVLDYDSGIRILANVLREKAPEALARVHYTTLRDTIIAVNGSPKLKPPIHAYKDAGRTLAEWKADTFGPNDIVVIDSLTTFSDSAFNEALMLGGRLNQRPQLQDYGWMADSVKLFIEMLTDSSMDSPFKFHLVVNSHVRYFGGDDETQTAARGLPNAKGQEIPKIVSRYFNTVVLTRSTGSGAGTKRMITTQPQGVVEVATENPFTVKPSYPLETGLASLFHDILGHGPEGAAK